MIQSVRIAHISDLHFGRDDPTAVEALLADLTLQNPQLVIVSGDLTQRAHKHEFIAAAKFLQQLNSPVLVVPGNHDIPLHNVFRRLLQPLKYYRRHICDSLMPTWEFEQVAILGINTASPYTWKTGLLTDQHVKEIAQFFKHSNSAIKMLVTHHPLLAEFTGGEKHTWRSGKLRQILRDYGVNIVLSGHLHQSFSANTEVARLDSQHHCLTIQAGTAVSTRFRQERNAYNLLNLTDEVLELNVRARENSLFNSMQIFYFRFENSCWINTENS